MAFVIECIVLVVALGLTWRYLGSYMAAVYEGRVHFLDFIERPVLRLLGIAEGAEQSWRRYLRSLLVFSGVSLVITYLLLALQGHLPLNPEHLPDVTPALAFNTAVSFLTNTNWQNYSGGVTMSYLSQMMALAVQNFVSASVGIAVSIALVRGLAHKRSATIGNFWVDTFRGVIYILLPASIVLTLVFVSQGAIETLQGPVVVHDALTGIHQTILRGPVASQEVIKQLGTNGGGFFNANSGHPFENPSGLTNLLEIYLVLAIPFAPHLHLWQDGGLGATGRGDPRGDDHPLRRHLRVCPPSRARRQPGGARRRHDLYPPREHGRQELALWHRQLDPLWHRLHPDLDRLGQLLL